MKLDNPKSPIIPKLEGIHLFHYDAAPCAQRVRFALHEKGLLRGREVKFDAAEPASCRGEDGAWISRTVSLAKKEHLSAAYADIQPNLVVPALVHDGVLHIESMDIVEYLDETFGGEPLIPKHKPEQLADAVALTQQGKALHRSIRFVSFRWGLRGLGRLNNQEENQLRKLLRDGQDGEDLIRFYEDYNHKTITDDVYTEHLIKLNESFKQHEQRLQDGRAFLTGESLSMADVIWAMKTLRLIECGYPFVQCFPAYFEWYQRVSSRPSFQQGVMGKHRFMNKAFRFKAGVEHLMGIGLKREVLKRMD